MKLLYASDLHGHEQHYDRLHQAALAFRPDLIVLGGDLLPDDDPMRPETLGRGQPAYVRDPFRRRMTGLKEASGCKEIALVMGNHDWGSSLLAMRELARAGVVRLLEGGLALEFGGIALVGYSHTPPTPWYVKDFEKLDLPGDRPPLLGGARWDERFTRVATHASGVIFGNANTIADDLGRLTPPTMPWVFVAHCPPSDTDLDRNWEGVGLGSKAIRGHIEKHQPFLSLHGHIHESPSVTGRFQHRLGRTISVNVGQTQQALHFACATIDPSQGTITSLESGRQA